FAIIANAVSFHILDRLEIQSQKPFSMAAEAYSTLSGSPAEGGIMIEVVSYRLEGDIGVISVNNPPVNALGQGVREGLQSCLHQGLADDKANALMVIGEGRTFPAGADIRVFGKPPAGPGLSGITDEYETSEKLIVAAIHGTAL